MTRFASLSYAVFSLLAAGRLGGPHPHGSGAQAGALAQRRSFEILLHSVRRTVVGAAEAMPADKYRFAPDSSIGDFANVRTFSAQVKHLAATNYILAAAALGQEPPANAGDEAGPADVHTKADVLRYLNGSYDALAAAVHAIGNDSIPVTSSPISPMQGQTATRVGLIAEALIHSFDHYGQMVEYLRMNGVIPPNSR